MCKTLHVINTRLSDIQRSERTMQPHSRRSMAQAQIMPGIEHMPWRLSEAEAIQHNTNSSTMGTAWNVPPQRSDLSKVY